MMFNLKMSPSFGCNVSNHDLKNYYVKTMQYRDIIFLPNLSLMVIYWPKKLEASIILCHKFKCWQSLNNRSKCNVSNRGIAQMQFEQVTFYSISEMVKRAQGYILLSMNNQADRYWDTDRSATKHLHFLMFTKEKQEEQQLIHL